MKDITVKIEELAEKLDENLNGWEQYLNVVTGEVVSVCDDKGIYENKELEEEIENTDNYIRLPNSYEIHEYRIMKSFAESAPNERVKHELLTSLNIKKPYRRFKDTAIYLGVIESYYLFRFVAYCNIIEEWCNNHSIKYTWKEN